MPTVIEERFLRFEFSDDWLAVKYDDHPDYRERIGGLRETKAIDLVATFRRNRHTLHFIEVKDFRGHRIENRERIRDGELAVEVAQKVRDTIAGIIAAHHRGKAETWGPHAQCLVTPDRPVKVVLWLEEDLPHIPPGRPQNRASVLTDALKRELRWLTTKVLVLNIASGSLDGLGVTNLPGAGHQP
ncbi:hypothetical protein OJF2_10170 [Aquisphaera giovannonii]|uniref:NERD domain-containing protein n=1 Tax=Aquisphaera giovannonii TaxID=406548 RepID=A0A5B9VY47_9BACT|nr:hypothetical protein [Aquisphaera giovannonii]QEH32540.1 hypothetical protein OJF2_10170 [Aquisphaera giovannonii]